MFETAEQLQEKIRLGEDSFLECKEVVFAGDTVRGPTRDALADELTAFANAHGGVLVLGVEDKSRQVVGIAPDLLDVAERFVREVCEASVQPPLLPRIERLTLPAADGSMRPVLRVDIARSLFVHRSSHGYWYRVGSAKRQMAPDYLAHLMQQRSQSRLMRYDEQVVPETTLADLDAALFDRFRTELSQDEPEILARKLAMAAVDSEGTLRLTLAGVLLGTATPQKWLPHAYIQAVAYRGTTIEPGIAYQLDARDLTGPLDQQVLEGSRFVARNMRTEASKDMGRSDTPQYDLTAVFEALVNAVAHRDYSMYGAKIRLRMFDDRIELFSPGSLVNTMTVESLAVRQASRNETITSLLAKCPVEGGPGALVTARKTMMDRRGEGVPVILRRSQALSGKRPVYATLDESELILTIYAASAASAQRDSLRNG